MSAGELRHRIAFDRRTSIDDGHGNKGRTGAFAEQFVVWAGITPRFAGEAVIAARLSGRSVVTIRVRRSTETDEITADWRARNVSTGEIYNIRSLVTPKRPRGYRDLLCETGAAT